MNDEVALTMILVVVVVVVLATALFGLGLWVVSL